MITLAEIFTLIGAAIVIGILSVKLYQAVQKAESKLPSGASENQRLNAAIKAIIKTLENSKSLDKEALNALETIIAILSKMGLITSDVQSSFQHLKATYGSHGKTTTSDGSSSSPDNTKTSSGTIQTK